MVDGIDPTTGQPTDGFGVIIEPESGVGRPYRHPHLPRDTEGSGPQSPPLSTPPVQTDRQDKEMGPSF